MKQDISERRFIAWLFLRYSRLVISKLRDNEVAQFNATNEQVAVLNILANRGGKSSIDIISKILMNRRHSVSTLLERMQKRGLVKKVKLPKQKELLIEITEKGHDLQESITRDSIDEVFSSLSPEDIQKLTDMLRTLYLRSLELLEIQSDIPLQQYISK